MGKRRNFPTSNNSKSVEGEPEGKSRVNSMKVRYLRRPERNLVGGGRIGISPVSNGAEKSVKAGGEPSPPPLGMGEGFKGRKSRGGGRFVLNRTR